MKKQTELNYEKFALLLSGILLGWLFSTSYLLLSFIIGAGGLILLFVIYIFHKINYLEEKYNDGRNPKHKK